MLRHFSVFRHVVLRQLSFLRIAELTVKSGITAERVTSQSVCGVFVQRFLSLENSIEIWILDRCNMGKKYCFVQ